MDTEASCAESGGAIIIVKFWPDLRAKITLIKSTHTSIDPFFHSTALIFVRT